MKPSFKPTVVARGEGSSPSDELAFLVVGKLRRPHGVHGELIMEVITDFPERLTAGITLYVDAEHIELSVQSTVEE